MTPDQIEQIAREVGFRVETFAIYAEGVSHVVCIRSKLTRFASLVRAAALEDAAKVCEEKVFDGWDCAVAIRALSKQEGGE